MSFDNLCACPLGHVQALPVQLAWHGMILLHQLAELALGV